jgi:hypothetical protein
MAVKTYYGSAAYDPATQPRASLNTQVTAGKIWNLLSTKELANGDSATSTINMGRVSSCAIIKRSGRLYADAIAGLTDVDVGLGKAGVVKDADCLLDGWDGHAGGVSNLAAIDYADLATKCAWQLAGYATDPGGDLDVFVTLNAALTAGGTITLDLDFQMP